MNLKPVLSLLVAILVCHCSNRTAPKTAVTFQSILLDDTVGRHPRVADINDDGRNDIVLLADYVAADGKDQKKLKEVAVYLAPDWRKVVLMHLNYRACDMELADMDGDNDFDLVGRAAKDTLADEKEAMNFWLQNPAPGGNPLQDPWPRYDIGRCEYVKDMAVADFNRDGKRDYVARLDHHICLWLQENFQTWQPIRFAIRPHEGMDIGDLDGDGDPDMVLNGYWLETPSDPLTQPFIEHVIDSTWYAQSTGKWMDNSCRVFVEDMDGDKKLDVLFSHSEMPGYPISWYKNPADPRQGGWTEQVIGQVDYCHTALAGDLDLDGDMDVIAGELIHGTDPDPQGPHPVVAFLNQGDGITWLRQDIDQQGIYGGELGDLQDDGDLDLIGPRNFRTAPISLYINKAADALPMRVPFQQKTIADDLPAGHTFVGLTDVDRDGKMDILAYHGGEEGFLSWYRTPDFHHSIIQRGNFHVERPVGADIDQDGDPDLFLVRNSDGAAVWLENPLPQGDPDATWQPHIIGTPDVRVKDYGSGDFDRDGRIDVVFSGYEGTIVYFQNGPDDWQSNRFMYKNGHEGADIGDMDGDGDPDIVLNGRWFETPELARSSAFQEHLIDARWCNQTGSWQKNSTMVCVADMDGNGRADVVFAHSEWPGYPIAWYSAVEPRTGPWQEHIVDADFGWCETLKVGDVNGDRYPDILAARFERAVERPYDYWLSERPYAVRIYYNLDGKGKGWCMQQVSTYGMYNGHLADLEGDGDLDVIGPRSYWRGPISIWENRLK